MRDGETPPRIGCWHAQQATEKALKAALVAAGTDFPRTHNLLTLRALLAPDIGEQLPVEELAELTAWATESRYPGSAEEPTDADARRAVAAADGVLAVIRTVLA